MNLTMKELLTEWRKPATKRKQTISEGRMGEKWVDCMQALQAMAMNNYLIDILNDASNAIEQQEMGPADMSTCCNLVQDCFDDGLLKAMPHPECPVVTVYVAID